MGSWPVLTHYDSDHLARIALPLGGIGTGTVSLGGRGDLRHWEIRNRPAKDNIGSQAFFLLYARPEGGEAVTRLLEGPMDVEDYEGSHGGSALNHGLPRFRECSFDAAYPFGQVNLSDADVPLSVTLQAFNPLIPADTDGSSIPVAVLRYELKNTGNTTVQASVCGTVLNDIGDEGSRINVFRTGDDVQGLLLSNSEMDHNDENFGTIALTTTNDRKTTHREAWIDFAWGDSLLDFWDDFSDDGALERRQEDRAARSKNDAGYKGSLAAAVEVPPGETRSVTFFITWHFANRQTWKPSEKNDCCGDGCCNADERVGNYYTTQFEDAWAAAEHIAQALPELEGRTREFVETFCNTDLPEVVKEAALYNISTLRTQTCFRTEDGRFYGWEGCCDGVGCCEGSCTHVWNYEQAMAFLFGDLALTMREVEFQHATDDTGAMSFRVGLPLETSAKDRKGVAADGQMGCIMKMYRDWQLSGDDDLLKTLWPRVRKALEFCWIDGGWDADRDGVMEGCQHNTMDVEYYGPNPQMGTWYLGALRAAEEMARYVGEGDFADECRKLFENGSAWLDEHLFNGEYYEHEVRAPGSDAEIPEIFTIGMAHSNLENPEQQLGPGCLVDQLVGQYMAHICGLGYLLKQENVEETLRSIMKYNFLESFHGHFNHLRSFVLGDESALLMASYPRGNRPVRPFPYYNEVMTGFEYTAAVGMIYEGLQEDALKCISAIRARYDGRKRSPFNEAECGHHYARAMASWAAVLALTGFQYSAVEKTMAFSVREGTHFWSNGRAWGTCTMELNTGSVHVQLAVLQGEISLTAFSLNGYGKHFFPEPATAEADDTLIFDVPQAE